ncbi:MAG TPA: helix-turn-helix transcriptional regulator, partial [Gemmatimonadota bacterium]|nr:helix-turn-helix transcriptional regulator [Gemmatimonadota bacterium]
MLTVLHVTNGDCAAERIALADLGGEILPWRDVLHEGPVPAGLDDAGLRARRAGFLGDSEWAGEERVLRDLEERDARLAVTARDEIVLWFEPDLYDQLQLLQVLDRLSRDGFAVSQRVPQEVKPDRVVYEITTNGRAELRRWLSSP